MGFEMSSMLFTCQMLGNRRGNTLAEAESLTFDPPAGDTTATGHHDVCSADLDVVS